MKIFRTIYLSFGLAFGLVLMMLSGAFALQEFDAIDNGQIQAKVSSDAVNRIALIDDRIASVVGLPPSGWSYEHDSVTGDLFLIPLVKDGEQGDLSLFLHSQEGLSYQLTLTVSSIGPQQILIRNPAIARGAVPDNPELWQTQPRIRLLTDIVQALRQNRLAESIFASMPPETGYLPAFHPAITDVKLSEMWASEQFMAFQLSFVSDQLVPPNQLVASNVAAVWIGDSDNFGVSEAIIIMEVQDGAGF